MKKILFASTALVASAGIAAADIELSGSAGFGLIYTDDGVNSMLAPDFTADLTATMTGETDNGLTFGASFTITAGGWSGGGWNSVSVTPKANFPTGGTASGAAVGVGTAWVEGGFGKLSVGDVDNAVEAVVGGIADIGYSGLDVDDVAEVINGNNSAVALYEGTFGDFTIAASHNLDQITNPGLSEWAVAAGYTFGDYDVALGYSSDDTGSEAVSISAGAAFGDITVGAMYTTIVAGPVEAVTGATDVWGLDASYTMGAVTITAAYADADVAGYQNFGIGASYDLGGGMSVVGGIASLNNGLVTVADLGVTMSF